MNPLKYAQMMKYLTRAKKTNPELPDVFPASKAPIPAKSNFVETKDAINRFVRANPRTEKAGGGMLVQPGFGGTRQGYAEPVGNQKGKFRAKSMDNISDAILKSYADDDIQILFEKSKSNPQGLLTPEDSKAGIFSKIKTDQDRLKTVVENTGLDQETILNILDDRDAFLELEKTNVGQQTRFKDQIKFFNQAEKWLTTNAKRYSDPVKFEKAFARTFGKNNPITKTIKANITETRGKGRLTGFSDDFVKTIMSTSRGIDPNKTFSAFNSIHLKDMFKTVIYNNNPNVRKRITTIFENILPEPGSKRTPDIRKLFENDPVLKKFGLNKSIKGPIARLIANEINEDLLANVKNFQKPFLGTEALLSYLKDRVDPKYKEMFREAGNAVKQAQKNQWPEAKKSLNISQSIMFDHKIPKSIIDLGYADEIEYIKLNPTSEKFNATVKRSQFDRPMLNLISKFENSKSLDAKAAVVKEMNDLKNKFSKKYGGYLDEVTIVPDKTGKPIFKSSAAPVTKKTDFVSSLKKSMVQTGEVKKGSPLYNKLMKFCPKNSGGGAGVCTIDEAMDGLISESKQLQSGNMNDAQAKRTAQKIRAVTRVGTGATLTSLLGPYGLLGEVVIDGGLIANRMLDGGDTYKEALSKSLIKYAMPTDARKQLEKETDRDTMILGSDTQGLAADFVSAKQKYEDLIKKYENLEKIKKDRTFDPDTLIPTYSAQDEIRAQKEFEKAQIRAEPLYGKNIFDVYKFGSPEQQAFAAKEEVFDAQKMQNKMDYDRQVLGPIKDLFGTGFYSPAQQKLLELKADEDTELIGQIPDELKTQQIANFGGVANLAGGGIAKLAGVDSGPPPESGPMSQGLPGLLKRGMKI